MATYYRLAQSSNQLPTHWAYSDGWQYEAGTGWVDQREEGFQVWSSQANVISTLMGSDRDGVYSSSDYPYLLLVDADQDFVVDGAGEWFAVQPGGLESLKSIKSSDLLGFVVELWNKEKDEYGYEEDVNDYLHNQSDFQDWLDASEVDILAWIEANAVAVEPNFVDTIPCPQAIAA